MENLYCAYLIFRYCIKRCKKMTLELHSSSVRGKETMPSEKRVKSGKRIDFLLQVNTMERPTH